MDDVFPVDVGERVAELHADVEELALAHHARRVLEVVLQRGAPAVGHLDVQHQRVLLQEVRQPRRRARSARSARIARRRFGLCASCKARPC